MKFKYPLKEYLKLAAPPILFIIIKKILNSNKSKSSVEKRPGTGIIKLTDELFILGNSPTINDLDVAVLLGKDVFVCNDFYKHSSFQYIKENCNVTYFAMDSLKSWENTFPIARKIDLDTVITKYYSEVFSEDYFTFVPIDLHEYLKINNFFPKCKIESYSFNEMNDYFKTKVILKSIDLINLDLALDVRHTPNAMLQFGILNEYAIINLHGLQHSYVKDRFDSVKVVQHFYEETEETYQNMEHRDLTELFLDSHLTFNIYRELNKLAKLLNVKIYDYTIDGCLDMFEKRST